MNRVIFILLYITSYTHLNAQSPSEFFSSISDLTSPTDEEYIAIETYIQSYTPNSSYFRDWKQRPQQVSFKLLDNTVESITHTIIPVKTLSSIKENCIYIYSDMTSEHCSWANDLVTKIQLSDFIGHIILQKGGWPNIDAGDIIYSFIPKAAKLCALREAKRLGYKKALYIERELSPTLLYTTVFLTIANESIYGYKTPLSLTQLFYGKEYISIFNLPERSACRYYTLNTDIFGVDLENENIISFLDDWENIAQNNETKCWTQFVDHTLISVLINQYFDTSCFSYTSQDLLSHLE